MGTETMLIIACVVGAFVAAVFIAYRSGNRQAKSLQEFASTRGWNYSRIDTQGLASKIDALFPDQRFSLENIMTVESGSRNIYLFDCGYRYQENRSGGSFGSACLIESAWFRSVGTNVEIVARTWADAKLLSGQIDLDDAEFVRNFIVLSKDPATAKKIVNARMREILLAHSKAHLYNPVRIGIGPVGAVLLTGYQSEQARWLDLLDLARQIELALK
jgi:hypothetical protein